MDGSTDGSSAATVVDPKITENPTSVVDEHDVFEPNKISLVSIVYVGSESSETWVTDVDKLEIPKKMMETLSTIETLPLTDPALDDICAIKDPTDGQWYRVKIVALEPSVLVHYIDFGNECEVSTDILAVLPDELKIEPPLAKKVSLKGDNPSVTDFVPSVHDVLEVKYDGKEADGTLMLEVIAVKGISDPEDNLSDDGKGDPLVNELSNFTEKADPGQKDVNSEAALEELTELENLSVEQIEEVQAASTLREEAHSTVQEILKKLDEELPTQDEVAMQTRLEVEKTMKEVDGRSTVEDEVSLQTRLQVQKIMEGLDEKLQKQQEAALASMRQMMETALSQSLYKIDRIQKDLHKLYATSRQQQRKQQSVVEGAGSKPGSILGSMPGPMQGSTPGSMLGSMPGPMPGSMQGPMPGSGPARQFVASGSGLASNDMELITPEVAYQRNQYNRPITRNVNVSDFTPEERPQRCVHFTDDAPGDGLGIVGGPGAGFTAGYCAGRGRGLGPNLSTSTGAAPFSPTSPRLDKREARSPSFGSPGTTGLPAMYDQNSNMKRSVSLRLKQAGDTSALTTAILSIHNLAEVFTCDSLCTLFGLYGNVSRAKILFNQKGKALVEMSDAAQASAATKMLDGAILFGQTIHVRPSTFEKLMIHPLELTNNTAKDNTRLNSYQANAVRRFKKGFWDPSRLAPPSETLRVSNILKTVPDDNVRAAFTSKGFEVKSIRFYPGQADKKAANVVLGSTDEAFRALQELHNTELSDWMPMKITFSIPKRD